MGVPPWEMDTNERLSAKDRDAFSLPLLHIEPVSCLVLSSEAKMTKLELTVTFLFISQIFTFLWVSQNRRAIVRLGRAVLLQIRAQGRKASGISQVTKPNG